MAWATAGSLKRERLVSNHHFIDGFCRACFHEHLQTLQKNINSLYISNLYESIRKPQLYETTGRLETASNSHQSILLSKPHQGLPKASLEEGEKKAEQNQQYNDGTQATSGPAGLQSIR